MGEFTTTTFLSCKKLEVLDGCVADAAEVGLDNEDDEFDEKLVDDDASGIGGASELGNQSRQKRSTENVALTANQSK